MTIFNIIGTGDRAIVAADTGTADVSGDEITSAGHNSKLFVVPHLQAVLVESGSSGILHQFYSTLCTFSDSDDVLSVGQTLGQEFRDRFGEFIDAIPTDAAGHPYMARLGAYLVGWSPSYGQTVICSFNSDADSWGEAFSDGVIGAPCSREGSPDTSAPEWKAAIAKAKSADAETALDLARLQYGLITDATLQKMNVGGHLSVAEITKDGINVRLIRYAFAQPAAQAPSGLSERLQRERDAKRARKAKRRSRAA